MPASYILNRKFHILSLLVFCLFIVGCGGTGGYAGGTETGNPVYGAVSGVAQKGPFQLGTEVTAKELDANLSPTGIEYTYQINSDLGTFSPNATNFTSRYIELSVTGYYYDEVTGTVSTGEITLRGISDLGENSVLNVNLLTTLSYERIKKLVTTEGMSIEAARIQAENEVLAAFHIPNGSLYGHFSGLDISGGHEGDYILAAISCIFVRDNNAEDVSELIAKFQLDIAEYGVLVDVDLKATLASSALALNVVAIAANLNAKYAAPTFTAADIINWIDWYGIGVVGKFFFQVPMADDASTFTFPDFVVDQLAGLPITASAGQLEVNGSIVTGSVVLHAGDTVVVKPPEGTFPAPQAGTFPSVVFPIYLQTGAIKLTCVTFKSGPGNLTEARSRHTATLLENGKVLVAGGINWMPLTSVELYDPAIGDWSAAAGMVTERLNHTATLLGNGKVLVTGGRRYGEVTSLAGAELYDPATNTWSAAADMITARAYHTATLLSNGKVLVVGGSSDQMSLYNIASAELYDPATDTWSEASNLATARSYHTATLLNNGNVLVAGGVNVVSLAGAELYDPEANTWSAASSLTTGRSYHTATLLGNGNVLVTGGVNGVSLAVAELYDPDADTWSAASSMTTARAYHTATLLNNGKVLVAAGSDSYNSAVFAETELYDPATNIWSSAGSLAKARSRHTATLLGNGKVLVAGGSNVGSPLSSVELSWLW